MKLKYLLPTAIIALAGAALLVGSAPKAKAKPETQLSTQIQRGEYLVKFGDCATCHTPLKFGPNGPEPDKTRFLSGHPEAAKLPPPDLKPGPWFAATAGMTAWAGPWGISYAANITPDKNTGIGIWTEQMFLSAMRTGKHMGAGRPILPPMPWQSIGTLNDDDIKAIYAYLQTVPAITNHVPEPATPNHVAAE